MTACHSYELEIYLLWSAQVAKLFSRWCDRCVTLSWYSSVTVEADRILEKETGLLALPQGMPTLEQIDQRRYKR